MIYLKIKYNNYKMYDQIEFEIIEELIEYISDEISDSIADAVWENTYWQMSSNIYHLKKGNIK